MSEHVKLVPYDPAWPGEFKVERNRIASRLGDIALRIDHHGSTSIPGLAAKPVIDIQVSVAELHPIEAYAPLLAQLGYEHLPHPDDALCPFFYRPSRWPHSHHVHVVQAGGVEERRTLAFRDYLRENPSLAREYQDLKLRLAPNFSAGDFVSRQAYADSKGHFINRITELALARGYPREPLDCAV
jgi:GrpB-like predicted nucleotidyltransferase (UPF0157 family)